jgi:hypothetical protein
MPRVAIFDSSNTGYQIDSFDWDAIKRWLAEWAPILHDPDYPLRMQIMPLFHAAGGGPDWNADARFFEWFEIPSEPDAIMARIREQRQRIERAKAGA